MEDSKRGQGSVTATGTTIGTGTTGMTAARPAVLTLAQRIDLAALRATRAAEPVERELAAIFLTEFTGKVLERRLGVWAW